MRTMNMLDDVCCRAALQVMGRTRESSIGARMLRYDAEEWFVWQLNVWQRNVWRPSMSPKIRYEFLAYQGLGD